MENPEANQIALGDSTENAREDETVYKTLIPTIQSVAKELGVDAALFRPEPRSEYCSVLFDTYLAFRIRCKQKGGFLEVPPALIDEIPASIPYERMKSTGYGRIAVDFQCLDPVLIPALLRGVVDRIPNEFDCCSRYQACSDAGVCVHPGIGGDRTFSLRCSYRKVLKSGRNFYAGKDREE